MNIKQVKADIGDYQWKSMKEYFKCDNDTQLVSYAMSFLHSRMSEEKLARTEYKILAETLNS